MLLLIIILYRDGFCDGTAANDQVALIENHRLSWSDSPLGCVKFQTDLPVCFRVHSAFLLVLTVAGLDRNTHRLGQGREGEPGHILRPEGIGKQGVTGTEGHGVPDHILPADIGGRTQGDAESLSLADGVADSTLMGADHPAL